MLSCISVYCERSGKFSLQLIPPNCGPNLVKHDLKHQSTNITRVSATVDPERSITSHDSISIVVTTWTSQIVYIPLGAGDFHFVSWCSILARLHGEHLHLLLEAQLLRQRTGAV